VADEGLKRPLAVLFTAAVGFGSTACGGATPAVQTANVGPQESSIAPFPEDAPSWSGVHSARFAMTIPLPNADKWRVDDTSRAEMIAVDGTTRSTLVVMREVESGLVNHAKCEQRAVELALEPERAMRTIEDVILTGPEAYDTHVKVEIEPRGSEGVLVGHLFAFGAYVRRCLFVHMTTAVPSERDEETLSQRLAVARVKLLGGIRVDELEAVPREVLKR
jgi:hypothetical protein